MITNKCKSFLTVLGVSFALSSGAALSAPTIYTPITGFQDDDLDWVIDNNNNGIIDIGDDLIAVVEITNTFSVLPAGSTAPIGPGEELTGIVELTVTGDVSTTGIPGSLEFGPMAGGVLGGNDVIGLWLDGTPDLDVVAVNCGSLAACTALAIDGASYLTAGLIAANGDSWAVPGGGITNIATVLASAATTTVGFVNFDTTITSNGAGLQLLDNNLTGSGNILGGQGLTNGAIARSDFDFQINVPEPGVLALFAIGLMGFGFANNKKRQA
ncbi:MAG TPA: PEP-CTERM sorting domain-containing protein [Nitrosomonas sp.]|uniref:PEP-CTERM sorting domain-containing protein n=1 Tax=Nitrosomonas sp. TaxID=42353 RepID=UPI0020851938|nr:PEP-CTERM sorting domain-containing protein [Nitrosomonas sp.]GJL76274.1 MAG: hypothetical protein NMNS02_23800 [Nitrosomonas sp.]HNP26781.1 PEP-CTERM sorting domain-containing protein [Nitrosomonas sp.]